MRSRLLLIWLLCIYGGLPGLFAQSVNNDCSKATAIPMNGVDTGMYYSPKVKLKGSGVQLGESFDQTMIYTALDKKSVWFSFELKVPRMVEIHLRQKDSAMGMDEAGFTVYKTQVCLPNQGQKEMSLTPIPHFGSAKSFCLRPGKYLIQINARQHANDTVWTEVHVSTAGNASNDHPLTAYTVVLKPNESLDLSWPLGCYSVDNPKELDPALGRQYQRMNQTSWVSFQTPANIDFLAIRIDYPDNSTPDDSITFGYSLYEGSEAKGIPLKRLEGPIPKTFNSAFFLPFVCSLKPSTWYTFQFFNPETSTGQDKVTFYTISTNGGWAADPKSLPSKYRLGTLQPGSYQSVTDTFSCNSMMKNYVCGDAVKDKIPIEVSSDTTVAADTFDMNSWATFSLAEPGILSIDVQWARNSSFYTNPIQAFRLYKGDVTKDCRLPLYVTGKGSFLTSCMQAGDYSLQLLGCSKSTVTGSATSDIGFYVKTNIRFTKAPVQKPAVHYLPSLAENLGNITSKIDSGVSTGWDYFNSPEDTIIIDTLKLRYRFVYREFYLAKDALISITDSGRAYVKLVSGRISTGTDKVHLCPQYQNLACQPMPAGWYTIISYAYINCSTPFTFTSKITIKRQVLCITGFSRPSGACKVNNLEPLEWKPDSGSNVYKPTAYNFPEHCSGCNADANLNPFTLSCIQALNSTSKSSNSLAFYVFTLSKESSFYCLLQSKPENALNGTPFSPDAGSRLVLLKADVRKDSAALHDPGKIISPCDGTGIFCNIEAGTYTLVVLCDIHRVYLPTAYVFKTPTRSRFDFASQAEDLGLLPSSGTVIISSMDTITCTTTSFKTDPDWFYSSKPPVPLNLPPNSRIDDFEPGNIWYSFSCAGTGKVTISGDGNKSVYKSNANGSLPLHVLKAKGQLDSTYAQGLSRVPLIPYNSSVYFSKQGCDTARYFVVVRPLSSNFSFSPIQLSFSYKGIADGEKGDHCWNAITMTLDSPGNASASAVTNCHSIGGDYGEDGSNMGCLGEISDIKTTWFKFSYTGRQKVDLRIYANSKSRLLYGSCDAMKPGPCGTSNLGEYELDCMGPGDYYIQVSSPVGEAVTTSVSVWASPSRLSICKPLELFKPLANFYTSGGCNGQPVRFLNRSSAGKFIVYHWNFGNGQYASIKNPVMKYRARFPVDTFTATLTVTDTVHHLSDSLTQKIYVFRDSVPVETTRDTSIVCGKQLPLFVRCPYPFATYHWYPEYLFTNPYDTLQLIKARTDMTIKVQVKVADCIIEKNIKVRLTRDNAMPHSRLLCNNAPITLHGPPGMSYYSWTGGFQTQNITVDTPGAYVLFSSNNICSYYDTVKVYGSLHGEPIQKLLMCQGHARILDCGKPGFRHLWSNGDTDQSITVNIPGVYWVRTYDDSCAVYDSFDVSVVDMASAPTQRIGICEGNSVFLSPAKPAEKYYWLYQPDVHSRDMQVSKPDYYIFVRQVQDCIARDTFQVFYFPSPHPRLGAERYYCELNNAELDGGEGASWYWLPDGQTTRKIQPAHFGRYTVHVTNSYGCLATDSVDVTERCLPIIYVPNSFHPDKDGVNDTFKAAGKYITYFEMRIYNRWGEEVFYSDALDKGWDGKLNGYPAEGGVYIWIIRYKGYGANAMISGNLTLIK